MNTNKSLLNKLKKAGIGLTLGLGFVLLSDVKANAQVWRQDRRDDRQERRDDRRDARSEGYKDGLEEGAEDARAGRRANAYNENSYRGADGHNSRSEVNAYRSAFVQGYNEGYNRYMRDNRSRNNRNGRWWWQK